MLETNISGTQFWFGKLSLANKKLQGGLVKIQQKIIGITLNDLSQVYQVKATKKAKNILFRDVSETWQTVAVIQLLN